MDEPEDIINEVSPQIFQPLGADGSKRNNQEGQHAIAQQTTESVTETIEVKKSQLGLPIPRDLRTNNPHVRLRRDCFGVIPNKLKPTEPIYVMRYTWMTANRMTVQVMTYGATITAIKIPNRKGKIHDVVMGFDDIEGYQDNKNPLFGAVIGRVANVIALSNYEYRGEAVDLKANKPPHHFNGGKKCLSRQLWDHKHKGTQVTMTHFSKAGIGGYPGNLVIMITFDVTGDNKLIVEITARTDRPTPVNITDQHYFNLAGHGTGAKELYRHLMEINSEKHTIIDSDGIPTGKLESVAGAFFDFRYPRCLGAAIRAVPKGGFNNNMCITRGMDQIDVFTARVIHPESGRTIEIYSDQPGLQFYTGNDMPDPFADILPKNFYDFTLMKPEIIMLDKGTFVNQYMLAAYARGEVHPDEIIELSPEEMRKQREALLRASKLKNEQAKESRRTRMKDSIPQHDQSEVHMMGHADIERVAGGASATATDSYPPAFLAKYGKSCSPECPCRLTDSERELLLKSLADRERLRQEALRNADKGALGGIPSEAISGGPGTGGSKLDVDGKGSEGSDEWGRRGKGEGGDERGISSLASSERMGDRSSDELDKDKAGKGGKLRGMFEMLEEPIHGKDGALYCRHGAFCLSTQGYPDAVHHENFPCIILVPGQIYHHKIIYKFGLQFKPEEYFLTTPSNTPIFVYRNC